MGTTIVEDVEVSTEHWIGGRRVASADTFTDVSPIDETTIAEVARGGRDEADAAVAAARDAFAAWGGAVPEGSRRRPARGRPRGSRSARAGAGRRRDARQRVAAAFDARLGHAARRPQLPVLRRRADRAGRRRLRHARPPNHVSWDPAGVAAVITPWNAPLMLATWRLAPALAAGNTVVLKPPEWAPLTASMLADIPTRRAARRRVQRRAGDRRGGRRRPRRASRRRSHRVHGLGRRPGKLVAAAAGAEPDAGLARARRQVAVRRRSPTRTSTRSWRRRSGQFDNAGQVCLAGTRLLVEDEIHDEFLDRFLERAAAIRQGDPRDEATDIGPLITREHFERVDGFVRRATAAGARAALGGGPNEDLGGLYYRPTLFADAPPGAEILPQRSSGPCSPLQPFGDEDEAVAHGERHRVRPGRHRVHGRPGSRATASRRAWRRAPCG